MKGETKDHVKFLFEQTQKQWKKIIEILDLVENIEKRLSLLESRSYSLDSGLKK